MLFRIILIFPHVIGPVVAAQPVSTWCG